MEIEGKYYVSEENNKLSIGIYSYKEAKEILEQMDSDDNRHCIDCRDCTNCTYCYDCDNCQDLDQFHDMKNISFFQLIDEPIFDYGKY
ncbi:MAG: hypothetical protein DRG78_11430 [Epsilonproteobacteria bacterium]|nr:MAG: hypothetical protein DRG78_11430 [Campylobacterota bacterium]